MRVSNLKGIMNNRPFDLAAIDLDGTLLGPDGIVGPRNTAAVERMLEAGITVVLASGRMHSATAPTHSLFKLTTPIVSYNGALVMDPNSGKVFRHISLDAGIAQEVVEWGEAEGRHINYYFDDTLYVDVETPWSDLYNDRTGSQIHAVGSLRQFDGTSPTKIIYVGEPDQTRRFEGWWKERLGERAYIVRTMMEYLEFLNPLAHKGEGVRTAAELYGVPMSRVAAFGDSLNDIPMIEAAGMGVAMPYSHPDVIRSADLIPEGGPEEAFAVAVESLLNGQT